MRSGIALGGSVFAACMVLNAPPAHASGRATPPLGCKAGAALARVAGRPTCLTVGQTCLAERQPDYKRATFVCRRGHLQKASPLANTVTTTNQSPAPGSSRANPVPLGKPGGLGNGWSLTITDVNPDATSAILAADPTNAPPAEGFHYVLVTVTATYNGPGSSHLTPGSSFHAVGASNVDHSTGNSFCGDLPPPNLDLTNPLVFSGGTESGYAVCWMVTTADAASFEMYYETPLSSMQVWFALR